MFVFTFGKVRSLVMAASAIGFLAAGGVLQGAPYNIVYTCTGTFSTSVTGTDQFKLGGEPFSISVLGNEGTLPVKTGTGYGAYNDLKLKGTVHSGLDPAGVPITSQYTFLVLARGTANDLFEIQAPVKAIQQSITISAKIQMPSGTLKTYRIYPFTAAVSLGNSSTYTATVTYTNGTNSTTLTIAAGTLNGTFPTKPATEAALEGPGASGGSVPTPAMPVAPVDFALPEERLALSV